MERSTSPAAPLSQRRDAPPSPQYAQRPLRVVVAPGIARTLVAPALPRLLEQHPTFALHLLVADRPDEWPDADAAVVLRPANAATRAARAMRIAEIPHVLCASDGFLSLYGQPRSPYDIDPDHCIGLLGEQGRPRPWRFLSGSTELTIDPAAPLMFSDPLSAAASAIRGGGLILVPQLAVEADIAAGLLTPLLPAWHTPTDIVWLEHFQPLTQELANFADFLRALFPYEGHRMM